MGQTIATTILRVLLCGVLVIGVGGCAEFNYRGGLVAKFEDWALFRAHTKSHRLIRSYILVAALANIARNAGLTDVEKDSVSGRLKGALTIIEDGYNCLYPDRERVDWSTPNALPATLSGVTVIPCTFFDERMARLDYAIYRLAADVLIDNDSQALLADVRDKMIGEIPIVGRAVRVVSSGLETAKEVTGVANDAATFAESLVRLSFKVSPRLAPISSLYRDTMEFDMRLVLDALREACPSADSTEPACVVYDKGVVILADGNGDIGLWRDFLDENVALMHHVQAYPLHFAIVARWLYATCSGLYAGSIKPKKGDDAAVTAISDVISSKCSPLIEFQGTQPLKVAYRAPRNKRPDDYLLNAKRKPNDAAAGAFANGRGQ